MSRPDATASGDSGGPRMILIYVAAIAVEVLVLLGLWSFSRYFG